MDKKKQKHIVFQVLNFLYSEDSAHYQLSADEQLTLICLASHKGEKGIYPAMSTIAQELKRSRSAILRTLQRLQEKEIIKIIKRPGRSGYIELSTACSVDATCSVETTCSVDATPPVAYTHTTCSVDATLSTKKKNIKEEQREDPSLSVNNFFKPDKLNTLLCQELNLSLAEQTESFVNRCKRPKTQYEFSRWLKRGKEYKDKKKVHVGETIFASVENQSTSWRPLPDIKKTQMPEHLRKMFIVITKERAGEKHEV